MSFEEKKEVIAQDNVDLEPLKAIFVSTGMNLNDDVFLPEEIIAAQDSVVHKPVNEEHDKDNIIGHIVNAYIVNQEAEAGERDKGDDSFSDFDIITESVLYKFHFPDRVQEIKEAALAGEKFVSMEAWFTNYDYLLGEHVVTRNIETAFLDEHLRARGGEGEYEGRRIGRVLRGILFAGQGIVDNPANPRSIIINNENSNTQTLAGKDFAVIKEKEKEKEVFLDKKRVLLSSADTKVGIESVTSFKEESTMTDAERIKTLESELSEANEVITELKSSANETVIVELNDSIAALSKEKEELTELLKDKSEAHTETTSNFEAAQKENEDLKKANRSLMSENEDLYGKIMAHREAKRREDFVVFDLSATDLEEIIAKAKGMSDEEYKEYLSWSQRVFKIKVEQVKETVASKEDLEETETEEKVEAAEAALAEAEENPTDVLFNSADEDFNKGVSGVIAELNLFGKEKV